MKCTVTVKDSYRPVIKGLVIKDDKIKAIMWNVLRENQNIITENSIEISNEESDSEKDIAVTRKQSLFLLGLTLTAMKGNILKLNNLMFLKYETLLLMRLVTCLLLVPDLVE